MKEFRVTGKNAEGSPIQAVIVAKDKKDAVQILARKGIIINNLEPKRTFNYFITLPNKKKVTGQKVAFSKEELKAAFAKHGYEKVRIEPVLLDIKMKPSFDSILNFVNLSSFMLQEDMPYDKILELLSDEEGNPTMRNALKTIQTELKKGREGEDVFREQEHVFGKFPAYMLGLATKSGNMVAVYQATAKYLERDSEYRRSLWSAFAMPTFTMIVMIGAIIYYLGWVFPATASMFTRFGMDVPPMTAWTIKLSDFVIEYIWFISGFFLLPPIGFSIWFMTEKGAYYRDKWMVQIPMLGPLLHKTSIEIFFRVFAAIYAGAENNIETLRAASEACRNKWMEHGVKEIAIPLMLRDGVSLVPALHTSKVFNKNSLSRLKSGAETGNVLASAGQIARFYEQETTYRMQRMINAISTWVIIFIGVVITLLTIVSSEVAFITPPTPGTGNIM